MVTEVALIVSNSIHKTLSGPERGSPYLELWLTGAHDHAAEHWSWQSGRTRFSGQPVGPHRRLSAPMHGAQVLFSSLRASVGSGNYRFADSKLRVRLGFLPGQGA